MSFSEIYASVTPRSDFIQQDAIMSDVVVNDDDPSKEESELSPEQVNSIKVFYNEKIRLSYASDEDDEKLEAQALEQFTKGEQANPTSISRSHAIDDLAGYSDEEEENNQNLPRVVLHDLENFVQNAVPVKTPQLTNLKKVFKRALNTPKLTPLVVRKHVQAFYKIDLITNKMKLLAIK